MSSLNGFEDAGAWGVSEDITSGDTVKTAVKKDQVIKDFIAAQDDLRIMLSKVQVVNKDIEKLKSGNETLQTYIDNLARQIAKR